MDNLTAETEAAVEVVEHSNAMNASVPNAKSSLRMRLMRRTMTSWAEMTWMKKNRSHSRWLPRSRRTSRTLKPTSLLCERVQQLLQKEMTNKVSWLVGRSLPGHLPTVLNNVGEQMSGLWLSLYSLLQLDLATTGWRTTVYSCIFLKNIAPPQLNLISQQTKILQSWVVDSDCRSVTNTKKFISFAS